MASSLTSAEPYEPTFTVTCSYKVCSTDDSGLGGSTRNVGFGSLVDDKQLWVLRFQVNLTCGPVCLSALLPQTTFANPLVVRTLLQWLFDQKHFVGSTKTSHFKQVEVKDLGG